MSTDDPAPEPDRRRLLAARALDVAVWGLVRRTTVRTAAQAAEALRTQKIVASLADRYRNLGLEQQAGHLFEVMHAHRFNLDAIAEDSPLRAVVTEWVEGGSATAAADIRIVGDGAVVAQAQAKLMAKASAAAHELARPHYDGMQRLVPADKLVDIDTVLTKRLTLKPDGLRYEDYADARATLTDALHAHGVRSTPLDTCTVHRAAAAPNRWAAGQVAGATARQVAAATTTGAAVGGVVAGVVEAAGQIARVRAGETSIAAAACTAAGAAARGALHSGVLAGLGESVRLSASSGLLPAVFGAGTLPAAVVGTVAGVTEAGLAFARREIDTGELAARSCEAALQTGLVWACGAAGQTVIPVPVVGGLVGGFVGQLAAAAIGNGLHRAVAAARADDLDDDRIAVLEAETRAAVSAGELLSRLERELGDVHGAYVTTAVSPLVDDALRAVTGSGDDGLDRLVALSTSFAGRPVFGTADEFDRWMSDPLTVLTLDPNRR